MRSIFNQVGKEWYAIVVCNEISEEMEAIRDERLEFIE